MNLKFLGPLAAILCFSVSARAYDPNKPLIYEMRIAMEADNWFNFYSTATVLSKSDNFAAFRVVANSTTTPTYQLLVTTQGNVGIGTGNPSAKLDVNGTANASAYSVGGTAGWTGSYSTSYTDTIDSYTKLLLHMNGTSGSTTFTDSATGKTVTASGNAQISTAQSKFGGASGYFDGSGDYLSIPDNSDFYFGSSDFTIDFWLKTTYTGGMQMLFYQRYNSTTADSGIILYGSGTLEAWAQDTTSTTFSYYTTTSIGVQDGSWHHIAIVRNGGNLYLFVDGTNKTWTANISIAGKTLPDSSAAYYIGVSSYDNAKFFNGYLDEYRISNGIARWTSNFTPPTRAYGSTFTKTMTITNGIITGVSE